MAKDFTFLKASLYKRLRFILFASAAFLLIFIMQFQKIKIFFDAVFFSRKPVFRLVRLFLFLLAWFTFLSLTQMLIQPGRLKFNFSELLMGILRYFLVGTNLFFAISIIYFVIPDFIFQKRYLKGFFISIACIIVSILVHTLFAVLIGTPILKYYQEKFFPEAPFYATSGATNPVGNLISALYIIGLVTAIQLIKEKFNQQKVHLQQEKEKAKAQLNLLTAQVNPHFLFNTLNNIYSGAQLESPRSAKMIMELSHIMRYILEEGSKEWVLLESEKQLLIDYLNLEKVRYDERLDIATSFPENPENFLLPPLILLPFIENCFKHGASKLLNQPWISFQMKIDNGVYQILIMNGKPRVKSHSLGTGMGIQNTRSRLELIYGDNFVLNTLDEDHQFTVVLKFPVKHV